MESSEFRDRAYAELMRAGVPPDERYGLNPYWLIFFRAGVPVYLVQGQGGVVALAHRETSVASFPSPMSSAHERAYLADLAGRLRGYADLIERNADRCPSYSRPGLDLGTAAEMASEAVVSSFSVSDVRESYRNASPQRQAVEVPSPSLDSVL